MAHDPLLGRTLANYRIERSLGRGGMAQVYYGLDTTLQRPVAIKVIDARYQDDPDFARRFVEEARIVARWRHEHIIAVYYAGQDDGLYYFVMEYIDGASLEDLLRSYHRDGTLMPHADVLRVGTAVAGALDYAHRQGVVHRDVKPSNIMIDRDDRVVLADFGLALDMGQGSMGQVFGTPHYIAPEQARRSADAVPQSDVYALGVVLYEMLTGAVPFDDASGTAVAVQHMTQPPPSPRSINPNLNAQTEAVLLKVLAKAPEDRYPTAMALMDALRDALEAPTQTASGGVPDHSDLLPPAAITGSGAQPSRLSISEMLAQTIEDDPAPTQVKQAAPLSQSVVATTPVGQHKSGTRGIGALVALGAASVVVLIVAVGLLLSIMSGEPDIDVTTSALAAANATANGVIPETTLAARTQAAQDALLIQRQTADAALTGEASVAQQGTQAAQEAAIAQQQTRTAQETVNAQQLTQAAQGVVIAQQQTQTQSALNWQATDAAQQQLVQQQLTDVALATANAATESALTQAAAIVVVEPTVAFPEGRPVRMTYNASSFYLQNRSNDNLRVARMSFMALDANGQPVFREFTGDRWAASYSFVEREGRCVAIELVDTDVAHLNQADCSRINALTTPSNAQSPLAFWVRESGATQFAFLWDGVEIGRCPIPDYASGAVGFCELRVGQ